MEARIYTKEDWRRAIAAFAASHRVFAPVKRGEIAVFDIVSNGEELAFDTPKTRLSPKNAVFPQSERMFAYSTNSDDEDAGVLKEIEKDIGPQFIVGLRPCDARSFLLVRPNFDNSEYRDPWWTARFEATTFIGMACNEPGATCFCTSVGGEPHGREGLDALAVDLGERYFVEALNGKGEAFLTDLGGGSAADESEAKRVQTLRETAAAAVSSTVETDRLRAISERDLFEADFWRDTFEGCVNCGTCTWACPTCWCFDIQDETRKGEGVRLRNWDSCMFPLFTKHGMGHNPRGEKYQRVRQRFMHKFKYYMEKYDAGPLCVGCGRCIESCPTGIDIREAVALMNQYVKRGA